VGGGFKSGLPGAPQLGTRLFNQPSTSHTSKMSRLSITC